MFSQMKAPVSWISNSSRGPFLFPEKGTNDRSKIQHQDPPGETRKTGNGLQHGAAEAGINDQTR